MTTGRTTDDGRIDLGKHRISVPRPFNGRIKTAQQQTIIQKYGDWYTGR